MSILVFGVAVFALFAILTYAPGDPSLFSNAQGAAKNACGKIGSYLSSLVLQCFGIGAFLLPAALFFIAVSIHKQEGKLRLLGTLGGMTVSVMSLTVFLSLQWKYWPFAGTLLLTGGAFGAWAADLLIRQLNPLGSSIVSLMVFFLALVLSTPISVARMGGHLMKAVGMVLWHCLKFLATYLVYIMGLLAVKIAHWIGDYTQRAVEAAVARTREAREARKNRQIAAKAVKTPVIGVDEDEAQADAIEVTGTEVKEETKEPEQPAAPYTEVPNALPELEQLEAANQKGIPMAEGKVPEILPHEPREKPAKEKVDPATRALAKLKAGRSLKRGQWKLPPVDFLRNAPKVDTAVDRERLVQNSQILKQKFADFGIDGEVTAVRPGPVITLYEFKPGPGVKVSRIAALADDLSMALSAQSVRILAPLPGKSVVGIEIPSSNRETVYLREFLQHADFYNSKHMIPVAMGKDIGGQPYFSDLYRMPHLLCAGQTGAGKSVFMNGLICSLLYRFTPDELRMILVDPKFIEFCAYQDIPHLLLPVVDDPKQASTSLKWAVREMDRRYRILSLMGARNLASYNDKVEEMGADVVRDLLLSEENQAENSTGSSSPTGSDWLEAFEPDENGAPRIGKLPYIVIIIDELAELMMVARKEVEVSIARIAQKARAAGIHLVVATQRPSTDVITGLIKANLPSRVSFQLASYVDSKTILDRAGAERLLGRGDMLFIPPGLSQLMRLHASLVNDDEIEKITSFLKSQGKPVYRSEILTADDEDEDGMDGEEQDDELFMEAIELVKRSGHASASFLQRHLKVGYNRAARMIETMESRGIVGPADGARPREVLMR